MVLIIVPRFSRVLKRFHSVYMACFQYIDLFTSNAILLHEVLSEGNMGNITATLPIDISVQSDIFKIFQLGSSFSHHEIKIFLPSFMRTFVPSIYCSPIITMGHPMTRNPHAPRGHGGIFIYVCHSTIWLS